MIGVITMLRYTLNRFKWAIITLWAVITLTFIIMHTIPGNPFAKEGAMPPCVYENLQVHYGLDKPVVDPIWELFIGSRTIRFWSIIEILIHFCKRLHFEGFPVSLASWGTSIGDCHLFWANFRCSCFTVSEINGLTIYRWSLPSLESLFQTLSWRLF